MTPLQVWQALGGVGILQPRLGLFYVGKVCSKHPEFLGARVGAGHCLACNREWSREHYKRNVEQERERNRTRRKDYHARNKDEENRKSREWRKANPGYQAAATKKWVEKNKDAARLGWKLNRIIRRKIIGGQAIAKRYREEIGTIYSQCPTGHHVDHIIPLRGKTVCGLHVPWNLQYLPAAENIKKRNYFESA